MIKLKILVIGPSKSGKTSIANFLSESIDMDANSEVRPTQGARILEFESATLSVNNKSVKADVELWDCSGDHRFESCWPAMRSEIHGVIFVCSSTNAAAAPRELELLYNYFVLQPKLAPKQCLVLYNTAETQQDTKGLRLSSTFGKISQVPVNLADGGNKLRSDFSTFLISIINNYRSQS